ncbi:MAG: lysophospholipase [Oligoflexia bacterium]|nr:lysophospholipase [Oligoflexia bacterium]
MSNLVKFVSTRLLAAPLLLAICATGVLSPYSAFGEMAARENWACPSTTGTGHAWFAGSGGPNAGVALVIHGLNLRPDKMDAIVRVLTEQGISVLRASLSGHQGSVEPLKRASRLGWLREIHAAYCEARARMPRSPVFLVGYSLGALLPLDLAASFPEAQVRFDRVVLFAPALALTWTARLVNLFRIFDDSFVVPSANFREYRANPEGTPVAGYRAALDSLAALEHSVSRLEDIPTLVIMDPEDVVVSAEGVRQWIAARGLKQWQVMEISARDGTLRANNHHLIIDEPSVGAPTWKRIHDALDAHLSAPATGQAAPGVR